MCSSSGKAHIQLVCFREDYRMMHPFLVLVWYTVFPSVLCRKLALQYVPSQDLKKKKKGEEIYNLVFSPTITLVLEMKIYLWFLCCILQSDFNKVS